jgi:hypothetical protein
MRRSAAQGNFVMPAAVLLSLLPQFLFLLDQHECHRKQKVSVRMSSKHCYTWPHKVVEVNLNLMSKIVDFWLNFFDHCKFINISLKLGCGFIYGMA